MGRARILAVNTLRDILHQRFIYTVGLLAIVLAIVSSRSLSSLRLAQEVGETVAAQRMGAELITLVISMWSLAATVMGASQGAKTVADEVKAKTIVIILSRPVSRGEFLLGKLLGVQIFVAAVVAIGVLAICAMAWYFGLAFRFVFLFAVAKLFVDAMLVCTISVAIGTFFSGSIATIVALLLPGVGAIAKPFIDAPFGRAAQIAYYLAPAGMPGNLMEASFSKELLDPQYALYAAVLGENVLYAIAVMLLAIVLFSQREIRFT